MCQQILGDDKSQKVLIGIIDSKVSAILLNWWILPIGGIWWNFRVYRLLPILGPPGLMSSLCVQRTHNKDCLQEAIMSLQQGLKI